MPTRQGHEGEGGYCQGVSLSHCFSGRGPNTTCIKITREHCKITNSWGPTPKSLILQME